VNKIDRLWEIQQDISWLKKRLIGNGKRGVFTDISMIKVELENFKKNYISYKQLIGYALTSVTVLVVLIGIVNYLTIRIF